MNEKVVATGLSLVPFLYLAGLILAIFPGAPVGVYFAFATCVAIALLLGLGGATGQLWAIVLDLVLVAVVVVSLVGFSQFGGLAGALTAGVLIGLPFLLSALAWRERSGLAHRTLALGLAIAAGLVLLATRATVLTGTSPVTPTDFVQAFFTTNVDQLNGLVTFALGGTPASLPVRSVFDPWFTGFCGLAIVGVVLLLLRPRTGRDVPLPVAVSLDEAPTDGNGSTEAFSDAQRAVYRSRSHDRPATGAWPPGLGAVLIAALASALVLGGAFATPLLTPLGLGAGVLAALVALGVVGATVRWRRPSVPSPSEPPTSGP